MHAAFDVYACMHSYIQQHKNMFCHEVACRAVAAIDRMAAGFFFSIKLYALMQGYTNIAGKLIRVCNQLFRARHHRQMVVAKKEGMIVGQFMCSR